MQITTRVCEGVYVCVCRYLSSEWASVSESCPGSSNTSVSQENFYVCVGVWHTHTNIEVLSGHTVCLRERERECVMNECRSYSSVGEFMVYCLVSLGM